MDSHTGLAYVQTATQTVVMHGTTIRKRFGFSETSGLVDPSSGDVYLDTNGRVYVVSGTRLLTSFAVPERTMGGGADQLLFNPVDHLVYRSDYAAHSIYAFRGEQLVKRIRLPHAPTEIATDPRRARVYASTTVGTIVQVDGTRVVRDVKDIDGHQFEQAPLVDPVSGDVYITDGKNGGELNVLTGHGLRTVALPSHGGIPSPDDVDPVRGLVYADGMVVRGTQYLGSVPYPLPQYDPIDHLMLLTNFQTDTMGFARGTHVIQTLDVGGQTGPFTFDRASDELLAAASPEECSTASVLDVLRNKGAG